jgi:hypothetical protein
MRVCAWAWACLSEYQLMGQFSWNSIWRLYCWEKIRIFHIFPPHATLTWLNSRLSDKEKAFAQFGTEPWNSYSYMTIFISAAFIRVFFVEYAAEVKKCQPDICIERCSCTVWSDSGSYPLLNIMGGGGYNTCIKRIFQSVLIQQNVDFRGTGLGGERGMGAPPRGGEERQPHGVQRFYETGAACAPPTPKSTTSQSSAHLQSHPWTPASGYVTGTTLELPVGIRPMHMNPCLLPSQPYWLHFTIVTTFGKRSIK